MNRDCDLTIGPCACGAWHKEEEVLWLQRFPRNSLYEAYVEAWAEYHRAAHLVDGHIIVPRNREESNLIGKAVFAGCRAQDGFMRRQSLQVPEPFYEPDLYKMWNSAKLEALRRLGR